MICPLWSKLTPYRKEMIVLNSIIFCLFVCYPFESLFNESGIIVEVIVPYHCSCSSQSSPSCMSPTAESEQLFQVSFHILFHSLAFPSSSCPMSLTRSSEERLWVSRKLLEDWDGLLWVCVGWVMKGSFGDFAAVRMELSSSLCSHQSSAFILCWCGMGG